MQTSIQYCLSYIIPRQVQGRQNMLTPCAVYTGLYLYAGAPFGEKPRCSWSSASSPSRSRHGRRLRCHDHGRSVGIVGVPLALHFPELLEHLSFAQLSPAYKYSPVYTHSLTTCFAASPPRVCIISHKKIPGQPLLPGDNSRFNINLRYILSQTPV